ncbi:hypothetical protein C7B65_25080 [Phormidesmis priestleyi ULC007]|uniref:Uncharacterized protein n=1 Tax=Phormidesmis priestleyi ULC007 TaxID=1920490 RepID=A0A2T1D3V6_9CYAN|nr:hypothetical protein [Phormidesmis priestleyi]PSB15137.1 hypothetical protein C7B65_25080 [Phormidesmis priestleyi ULC007]PZO45903.1 MAG: hypothetical protein DCF14_24350 [Phormidesmis priestleyi]
MNATVVSSSRLSSWTTEELKNEILALTKDRDADPLNKKVLFYKEQLVPYFEELSRRNPYPIVEDQVPVVLGVWTPVWSTIPFHDSLPGRIHNQSYQIFGDKGYYGNIARYAPGNQSNFLQKLSSLLVAYDFMVLQSFAVRDGQWCIQNVGIEQAFRRRNSALTIDKAEDWFTSVVEMRLDAKKADLPQELTLKNLDRNTVKKFEKTYLASPKFEHLYVDENFRLVKTQREEKQRPSYTIAIRRR